MLPDFDRVVRRGRPRPVVEPARDRGVGEGVAQRSPDASERCSDDLLALSWCLPSLLLAPHVQGVIHRRLELDLSVICRTV
jgi:hypothetical protein